MRMWLGLCGVLVSALLRAQSVDIVLDPADPARDTLDFGATLLDRPVLRPVYLRNFSSETLQVPQRVIPYFSVERIPDQGELDFLEFDLADPRGFPIEVPPQTVRRIQLHFRAIPQLYPLGLKQAYLRLSLRSAADTSRELARRTFVLRGFKERVELELQPSLLWLDSVFVGAAAQRQLQLRVQVPAAVDTLLPFRTELRYRSGGYPGQDELHLEPLQGQFPITPHAVVPLRVEYRPLDRDADTVELRLLYLPYAGALPDTVRALLVGVGVEHRWEWEMERSDGVRQVGDTLDFGGVAVGMEREAVLRLRNGGNYHFHAADTLLEELSAGSAAAFEVAPHPFPDSGIAPGGELRLRIRFRPQQAGLMQVRYLLRSDIAQRIVGAPAEARFWSIVLRGVGIAPRLELVPAAVQGELLWSPDCPRAWEQPLELRNTGTAPLQIDSAWVARGAVELEFPPLPLQLQPGQVSAAARLRSVPTQWGWIEDTVWLRTNQPGRALVPLVVRLQVKAPPTIALRLPQELRVKPGRRISVPVLVGELPQGVARCRLVLVYEPTLLRWDGLSTDGTALEGAQLQQAREDTPGVFVLEAVQPYGVFPQRAELVRVHFRTFLGQHVRSPLLLQQVQFGDSACRSLFPATATAGQVLMDSVCGLTEKLLPQRVLRLEVMPNPAHGELLLEYELPLDGEAALELYDARGRLVQTLAAGWHARGVHRRALSVAALPTGQYFCRLRFAGAERVQPLQLR